MMDPIKTSTNVEFDVVYADGTRQRVPEGVLFEADGDRMKIHVGACRVAVLFAVAEALTEVIQELGLGDVFKAWLESWEDEEGEQDDEG